MEEIRPGQVISPTPSQAVDLSQGGEPQSRGTVWHQAINAMSPAPTATSETVPLVTQPEPPVPVRPPQPATAAQAPSVPTSATEAPRQEPEPMSMPIVNNDAPTDTARAWSATEYVHHEKHTLWYGLYVLGTLLLSAVVYFTTKDIMSTVIVFVAILGLVVFASRSPKVQDYEVAGDALRIGQKVYNLHDFKAFSVVEEGSTAEIMLHPLKRFLPMVSVYLPQNQVDDLADYLADSLPVEPYKPDAVDTLLRRIRF